MPKSKAFDVVGKGIESLKASPNKKFNAKDIARDIYKKYPEECEWKKNRSKRDLSKADLIQQIAREWHSHWRRAFDKDDSLRATEDRPKLFYISTQSEEDEVESAQLPNLKKGLPKKDALSEHELYPILGEFASQDLNCYPMRINELRSSNMQGKRGNHWLFPDIVGMIPLSSDWDSEVSELSNAMGSSRVRLCSFEVKKTINRSNVREVVFQTVSNSSWANYAYLVAASLERKATEELRMLCLAHGVGFILLNAKDAQESQIQIPAKLNDKINYDLLNRLATENRDAMKFLDNVTTFLKTGKDRDADWDLYPDLSNP